MNLCNLFTVEDWRCVVAAAVLALGHDTSAAELRASGIAAINVPADPALPEFTCSQCGKIIHTAAHFGRCVSCYYMMHSTPDTEGDAVSQLHAPLGTRLADAAQMRQYNAGTDERDDARA